MTHHELFHVIFSTNLGIAALIYREGKVISFILPHKNPKQALIKIKKDHPESKTTKIIPSKIKKHIDLIQKHLSGKPQNLTNIEIDISNCTKFFRKVYHLVRKIPPGKTKNYGEIALMAGSPGAARAVGQAMAKNPIPLIIPCHRILGKKNLGGFSGGDGLSTKKVLLALESS
ncbi:MAG: MGMT family protein [Bacteriovoracaceae bacterium]|nr:MGMT family protein [Bacteriovoracaceae bacterium]